MSENKNSQNLFKIDEFASLLWSFKTKSGYVQSASLSLDGSYIAIGNSMGEAYFFNNEGKLLWNYNATRTSISSDGSYIGAGFRDIKLFNLQGELLWDHEINGYLNAISISSDGTYIVAGLNNNLIYFLNCEGTILWDYDLGYGRDINSISLSSNANFIVVGTKYMFYLLNKEGRLLWSNELSRNYPVHASISPDGSYIVAGTENKVYLYNNQGKLLWNYKTYSNFSCFSFSFDGSFIAAGSNDMIYVFNKYGLLLWSYKVGASILSISLSADGTCVAVGSNDGNVYCFGLSVEKFKEEEKRLKEAIEKLCEIDIPNTVVYNAETELKVTVRNLMIDRPIEGISIDFSETSEHFKLFDKELKFPTLKSGMQLAKSIKLVPLFEGESMISIKINSNMGELKKDFIVKVTKPKKEMVITSEQPVKSLSYLSIERTIYEPINRNFIISSSKQLPNIKNWIEKNDPSKYWLVICVNNDSDKPLDEWGIELETPSTLKILDAKIEGTDHAPNIIISFSKPWLAHWILGIPHHLGIVIPKKGSKRIYFKLGSEACGVSYSIKGRVLTSDCEIQIKEKHFRYSCDSATLKVAIRTNPEEAEKYAQTVLSNIYSKDNALKLLQSFRIVQEIDRCCIPNQYGEIKFNNKGYNEIRDKLNILLDALESAQVGDNLIRMVKDNLDKISITGETGASADRIRKLCGNLPDMWINEVLKI